MRNPAIVGLRPGATAPSTYDYALFNLHDGVIEGSSETNAIDLNPENTWELGSVNFNSAVWTAKSGWWTGNLANQRALTLNATSFTDEFATFVDTSVFQDQCYLIACEVNLPAWATATQRVFCLGINNNADRFQVRYISGDILQVLFGDNDVAASPLDISSYLSTDLTIIGICDDREGQKTLYASLYQSGTRNAIASRTESTDGIEWSTSTANRYLQIGSMPNLASSTPLTGSVRRCLMVPMGTSPPADLTAVMEELALYRLTRFETL